MSRSKSSKNWLQEHHDDAYVLQARKDGYRSRAVYKLIEIQQKDQVLKHGQFVLELGAAPGGWSEYIAQFADNKGRLIAVDLLPIEPIAGVEVIQGDFTEAKVLDQILDLVDKQPLDLVLSDMAPNISGIGAVDQQCRALRGTFENVAFFNEVELVAADEVGRLYQVGCFDGVWSESQVRNGLFAGFL